MRIAVTGSSGKLGRPTVELLGAEGHEVLGIDQDGVPGFGFVGVNLTSYGETLDALLGVTARHTGLDALVHLAAIPVNGIVPDVTVFHNNMTVTFNVFHAAMRAGIRTIVYASSINTVGFPFAEPPEYLPLDENSPLRANNTYGLVKVLEETATKKVVGVHMIGSRSTELVAEATLALRLESTAEELMRTIHAHPTMAEAIGEAAHAVNGAAIQL